MPLTLTPDPVAATVRVAATGLPAGPITLTRTDINGAAPVRRRAGHGGSTSITVTDHDAARHGLIRYSATAAGTTIYASTTMAPRAAGPVLHLPVLPHYKLAARALVSLTSTAPGGHTAHDVIGRADPVVILAPSRPPRGSLTLRVDDDAAAAAVAALYATGHVAMLRMAGPDAPDLHHLAETVDTGPAHTGPDGRRMWDVTVSWAAVPAPTGGLAGDYGWTFADVTAAGTFAALAAAYADLDDVAVGP